MSDHSFVITDRSEPARTAAIDALERLLAMLKLQPDQIRGVIIRRDNLGGGVFMVEVRAAFNESEPATASQDAPERAAGSGPASDLSDQPIASPAASSSPSCSTVAQERPLSGMG